MDAAMECYRRLLAAQRQVSVEELDAMEAEDKREKTALKIKRRLPKAY